MAKLTAEEIRYLYAGGADERDRRLGQIRIARELAQWPLPTAGVDDEGDEDQIEAQEEE